MSTHQRSPKRAGLIGLAAIGLTTALAATSVAAATAVPAPPAAPAAAAAATTTASAAAAAAAKAAKTPNTAKLAGTRAKQKLTWETCDFGSDQLNERFNQPNVQCATVIVPRDWKNPVEGDSVAVRISQAKNLNVTNPRYKGTIFVNPGGPGGEGLPWGSAMQQRAEDLVPYYNFVGFDPRGVGQSWVPGCDVTYDENSSDPYEMKKQIAKTCNKHKYSSVISTEQTAYDMDFIRHLLKAPKLSYIGYSYGTWLGTWYENVFGANGGTFLLDSAIDATQPTLQRTWDQQPIARDRQFQMHLMNWIARHNDVYELGTNPTEIYDTYFKGVRNMNPFMLQLFWLFGGGFEAFPDNSKYPDAASVVSIVNEYAEIEPTQRRSAPATPAAQADELLAKLEASPHASAALKAKVKDGRADLAPLKALPVIGGPAAEAATDSAAPSARSAASDEEPESLVTGEFNDVFELVRCNDGQWTQGAAYWEAQTPKQVKKAPFSASFGLAGGVPLCAFWKTNTMMPVANPATFPSTIVVQGELDSQTAYEGGYAAGTKLPNTKLAVIDNEGSHGHFPYGTECVDRPIYNLFLNGKLPAKDVKVCQGQPLIKDAQTYETWTKLRPNGKIGTPVWGPWIPVSEKALKSSSKSGAPLQLIDPQVNVRTEQVIREAYGQAGVEAAKTSGLIR